MRGSKSKNTKPELAVRRALRSMGVGYRLHRRDLPGKPDIAMIGRRKAIFVHGCFWHQHDDPDCKVVRRPVSNTPFWNAKFARNIERDCEHEAELQSAGWKILTVWECEVASGEFIEKLWCFIDEI